LRLGDFDAAQVKWLEALKKDPGKLESVENFAKGLQSLVSQYGSLEASGDPQLDTIRTIRLRETFSGFASFLEKAASKNKDFATVLGPKVKESRVSAAKSGDSCQGIAKLAGLPNPATRGCNTTARYPTEELLLWSKPAALRAAGPDPAGSEIPSIQTKIFNDPKGGGLLELATKYLEGGHLNHAIAAALTGATGAADGAGDYYAVAACAAAKLGLHSEALFHLKSASSYKGLRERCRNELPSP
jgi:hypothetical protein